MRDQEKRAHRRVELPASAIFIEDGQESRRFVVQNLCAAGALLTGSVGLYEGQEGEFRIELTPERAVAVRGRVLRAAPIERGIWALALELVEPTADVEDEIQQAILDALEQSALTEPFFKPDLELAYA